MSKPVVVTIPHHLGRKEASRRLKSGLTRAVESFGKVMTVEQDWTADDHLEFRVQALGQTSNGTLDVAEDNVRLEVELPWGLGALVEKIKGTIEKRGTKMLENK